MGGGAINQNLDSKEFSDEISQNPQYTYQINSNFSSDSPINTNSKNPKKFCGGKQTFTGCFVGIEVGVNSLSFFGDKNRTFPFNVIFGYQHFFTHRHGLEIRANLGYSYDYQILYDRYASSADLHSVQYGLEMVYLLNFGKSKEKFAWGMDFGLGIGAVSFLGKLNGGDLEQNLPTSNSAVIEHNTIAYLTMLRLGFHWYYTSHLFWLNLKTNTTNARNNRYKLGQTPQTILDTNPSFFGFDF